MQLSKPNHPSHHSHAVTAGTFNCGRKKKWGGGGGSSPPWTLIFADSLIPAWSLDYECGPFDPLLGASAVSLPCIFILIFNRDISEALFTAYFSNFIHTVTRENAMPPAIASTLSGPSRKCLWTPTPSAKYARTW